MSEGRLTVPVMQLGELVVRGGLQTGPFGSQLKASEYVEQGIPVVMPQDIVGGRIRLGATARVSDTKALALARYRLRAGDVILARRGNLSKAALVVPEHEGWLCGTGCQRIRLDSSKVDSAFFSHYLRLRETTRWLESNALGQTMLNLNTSIVSRLPVPVPPMEEQVRVASLLAGWESVIRRTGRLLMLSQSRRNWLARAVLQTAADGPHRRAPIADIAQVRSGRTPSKARSEFWGGVHPWVSARDMKVWMLAETGRCLSDLGYSAAAVAPMGSVLVLTRGMTLFHDVPICMAGRELAFNQDVRALLVHASVNPKYVGLYLRAHRDALLSLVDTAGNGTGRLDGDELRNFSLLIPARSVQDWAVKLLDTADRETDLLQLLLDAQRRMSAATASLCFGTKEPAPDGPADGRAS